MKKPEFVKLVAKRTSLSQQQVMEVVEEISQVIIEQCRDNGEDVPFGSLGVFKQKVNPARKGRNPLNGETIDVKESHNVAFRPVSSLRKLVE